MAKTKKVKRLKLERAKTRKERVLMALELADRQGRLIFEMQDIATPDGWVDGYTLCHPAIGGSEGLRRLRELRALGHEIQMRQHPAYGRTARQYRIVTKETLFG